MNRSASNSLGHGSRLPAIDFVRGLAVIVMALDHTRDYFTNIRFAPEDLSQTWGALFFTRWATHFCAPAFFLLAGSGIYLYHRKQTDGAATRFLIIRGLWLMLLEFTLIGFAWTFQVGWGMFGVIWCLGASMIFLAAFIRGPRWLIGGAVVLLLGFHDLFDSVQPSALPSAQWLVFLLHRSGMAHFGQISILVLFPFVPWCGVMLLGFWVGPLLSNAGRRTRRSLMALGLASVLSFFVLRITNAYGNPIASVANSSPGAWQLQRSVSKSIILFFDVEKYPPSLQYLLMTLGLILLLLSLPPDVIASRFARIVEVYGRVPLFFYILHLFVIHIGAIVVAAATHQPTAWLYHGAFFLNRVPPTWGFSLAYVWLLWMVVVFILYWPCSWFAWVKTRHPDSLLRLL